MKKVIVAIFTIFIIAMGSKVYAAEGLEVQAVVNGKFEKGKSIEILINIKDIKSFYAGDIEYKYDPSVLKVKSIEPGDLISKSGISKFDAINKVDEQKGTVRYAFSCLGQIDGFSGTGAFVKINAEVLKDEDKFFINSKSFLKNFENNYNLKLQICDKDIKELDYKFTEYKIEKITDETKVTANPPAADDKSNTAEVKPSTSGSTGSEKTETSDSENKNVTSNDVSSTNGDTGTNTSNVTTNNSSENTSQPVNTKDRSSNKLVIVILIGLVTAAGIGVYFFITRKVKN
jgi:hypothetical protein